MSWDELKIGSFICQGQKAIAEVVGLRRMTNGKKLASEKCADHV